MNKINNFLQQFNLQIDRLLGISPAQLDSPAESDPSIEAALQAAGLLNGLDLAAEAAPRPELRRRWAQANVNPPVTYPTRSRLTQRLAWVAALVLALALLAAFRQPVLASVGRLFGYIYVQDSGFLPADSTLVLQQPVLQTHNDLTLTVTHAVSTPDGTSLYLEFSATAAPADGAILETNLGTWLALSAWEYFPNSPGSHGLKLVFPALPAGTTQTTLVLPAGWHLPLAWIPAAQSGLPDVRAVPYVNATQSRAPAADLCVEKHGVKLCLQAAATTADDTSVLMDATPVNPAFNLRPWLQGLVWQSRTGPVTLRDEHGNVYPLDIQRPPIDGTLFFPPLAGTHALTLTIPEVYASADIPQQDISVNVGADPQPGDVIPLDANIQVLGATVHFSKATYIGDGVGSLRLTLNADEPIQTVDGITPEALELGRPARVDDLYGSGALVDGKGLFVELIQGGQKITGVLSLPIVSATVIVQGPFTFTFNLSDLPALPTPTPLVVNSGSFLPAPTATALPLDSYAYSGSKLESGDLLYTLVEGGKTSVYAYTPATGLPVTLVATLPGAVSQVYIHPDRLGLDYLAGIQITRDGTTYIDSMSLYTLRFGEPAPYLLYNFAPNSSVVGTSVAGYWSYDGRLVIFETPQTAPGSNNAWKYIWFDLSCRNGAACSPHDLVVPPDFSLSYPTFAPQDDRILFTGLDTGMGGIISLFIARIDPQQPTLAVVKIPSQMSIADIAGYPAQWTPDGKVLSGCWDGTYPETDFFCKIDPTSGAASHGEAISKIMGVYRPYGFDHPLSPSGDQLLYTIFPNNSTDASIPDLRLLNLDGHPGAIIASSFSISHAMFSPSGQSVAYLIDDKPRLVIYNVPTGSHTIIFDGTVPSALTWMGWAP